MRLVDILVVAIVHVHQAEMHGRAGGYDDRWINQLVDLEGLVGVAVLDSDPCR